MAGGGRDILDWARRWLDGKRADHLARSVVYERGASSVEVDATPGRTVYEQASESGAVVHAVATDFILAAADLALGDEPIEPRAGDRIYAQAADGRVIVHEVLDLGGAGCWQPCDPDGLTLRIHTKRIGTAP
ncbi:MAG TPA: hypothetical protein PK082_02380 [Phycisphaerae bacterium]|nr:hypothetical protein [Phycisphaerae bacterium]